MQEQIIKEIAETELIGTVTDMKRNGYRLVAISCTNKNGFDLSYSFDKDYDFITFRIILNDETEIESISAIYSFAFLYENEISDLFGVKIKNMSINFDGNLYRISSPAPFGNLNCENGGTK